MTIDNKARFKNGPHSKTWSQVVVSEAFTEAANSAMLIMLSQQSTDAAAANSYRLEGARHFLGILLNLTSEKKDTRPEEQNLKTNI